MKYIIPIFLFLAFATTSVSAQKIYKVQYESQADLKVYIVKYESQCDLKVFMVKYESQADLKIFFVDYESQVGWNNQSKAHLLKF